MNLPVKKATKIASLRCILLGFVIVKTWLVSSGHSFQDQTPLMSAVRQNQVETVKALIANGAEVNAKIAGSIEVTALMIAARYGYTDIMKVLIDNGADVNAKSDHGYTALMRAARNGQTDAVKMLIQNRAEINVYNDGGASALWLAAEHNHLDIAKLLLANGANPVGIKMPEPSWNPFRKLAQTSPGRKINEEIGRYGFFAIVILGLILGVVSLIRLFSRRRRLFWDISIPASIVLLYLIYESAVPPEVNIRIDLLIIYPVLLFVVVPGLINLRRTLASRSAKDTTDK